MVGKQRGVELNSEQFEIVDGNQAVADVAYRLAEVISIYPITPSSTMAEWADQWSEQGRRNLWGAVPLIAEMQSEGGAAGAMHGALQAGSLSTTFTASQGLLLMIPNLFKIAGELTSNVVHVTARSVATHALSIFGDHSDVMACRATGYAMLASDSVQEAGDLALVAHLSTLEARVPFLHFFDGFRTSHEINKVASISDETIRALMDEKLIEAHRKRALSADRPILRGTAQNPDVFFQAREASNPYYLACPSIVQRVMNDFARLTGRSYHLFDYVGDPEADRVIVIMGSGAGAVEETILHLNARGEKLGLLKVRLYRPFATETFLRSLPKSVRAIAVLDRTKEPGAIGEPLYQDVLTAIGESMQDASPRFARLPKVIGGRYGLSSKEFTPAMVKGIFEELWDPQPKNHFTIGITDDVTHTSLEYDPKFCTEDPRTFRALFYGLGSDGTVGANKNSIKIIGHETPNYVQGYFVYDSKKSGSMTTSHLRFGPAPILSTYLITQANFVACHSFSFLERMDILSAAAPGAVFLLNAPYGPEEVWEHLPRKVQETIVERKLEFYVIDAYGVARETGMGSRINTVMQVCFFAISGVLPLAEAVEQIKKAIQQTYGRRGDVVQRNYAAVDAALAHLHRVKVPEKATSQVDLLPIFSPSAPEFVTNVLGEMAAGRGDLLPVSALPPDGTFPTGTTHWEKRNIAQMIPVWDQELCIQCGKCVLVCPHAAIRAKVFDSTLLAEAPQSFKTAKPKWRDMEKKLYALQVAPEDCTGCRLCMETCPAVSRTEPAARPRRKALQMEPQEPLRAPEAENWKFFAALPPVKRATLSHNQVKDVQLLEPLFEFSGACAGCGETPYIKLLTQLFGDRLYIANATGCSSIYGGSMPTTPYTVNDEGRGPTWANSLFEDNAEFGLGIRLGLDQQKEQAEALLRQQAAIVGEELVEAALSADQTTEVGIDRQRERVKRIRGRLDGVERPEARLLHSLADSLVRKSVWLVGGDGWAYDIGFGGVDHVLGSGKNVKILVLDTETYSNTGGQMSKSTPRGAVAKFASGGKLTGKKDLAMEALSYGSVYVARVAMGGSDIQTVKAFQEAEAYDGPALIIAYSQCIAHGYDLGLGMEQQKNAVLSGYWPLMRYNPMLQAQGKNPFQLDSKPPSIALKEYSYKEARYTMLSRSHPEAAKRLLEEAEEDVRRKWRLYQEYASGDSSLPGNLASKKGVSTSAPDTPAGPRG
jgi:pyruvate-ferredoxin/flavodoxin oxidoreductase